MASQKIISKAAAAKLLTKAGAKRVSANAAKKFASIIEESALKIAEQAVKNARYSGRKTVKEEDINSIKSV